MSEKIRAYRGTEKYLFVSYAHRDGADVLPALEALADAGYRVWYDEGIRAGEDWSASIGNALEKASQVVFFASDTSVRRDNVLRELTFAREHNIPILTVQLGKVTFPEELDHLLLVEITGPDGLFLRAVNDYLLSALTVFICRDDSVEQIVYVVGSEAHLAVTQLHEFSELALEFHDVFLAAVKHYLIAACNHFKPGKIRTEFFQNTISRTENFDRVAGFHLQSFLHND